MILLQKHNFWLEQGIELTQIFYVFLKGCATHRFNAKHPLKKINYELFQLCMIFN